MINNITIDGLVDNLELKKASKNGKSKKEI